MTPPPPRDVQVPTSADLAQARDIVREHLATTPLVDAGGLRAGTRLKLETLQPTGSFKVRGALAAASAVPPGGTILAVSAGNHALGIGWAAARLGIPATVVVARTASPAKLAKLESLPITLVRHGATYDEAEAHALALARQASGETVFISAYNDPLVIAGQSTVLDEIVAQVPGAEPLTVVVPVGGGGLLAGIALRSGERADRRPLRVVGVEAAASRGVSAAVTAGRVVEVPVGDTLADGLSGNIEPGSVTVGIIRRAGVPLVAVTEVELREAIRWLARECGIVAEGAGAAAVAALLAGHIPPGEGEIVAVVTGRNIALPTLAGVLAGSG